MDIQRFEIFPLLENIKINERVPIQISCVEVYNNDIFLGTVDSFIFQYVDVFDSSSPSFEKPRYKYLGLKKAIVQLKVASALNRILCVCDSNLIAFNLDTLDGVNNFKIKNVFGFCFNENPISMDPFALELCLVKRKSLSICLMQSDKITIVKEVNVPEQPVLLSMDGYFVCMASSNNYYIVDWNSSTYQLLCSNDTETFVRPICKFVSRNEFLINGLSHLGVFVKSSGISERPPIDWGADVLQIAYSYPYILCMRKDSISIISVIDQKIKEEFQFQNGVFIDNFDGKIVVATFDSIFFLRKIPWEEQINSLLENGGSQEAIDLCYSLYESGLISNTDIDYAKMVMAKASLIELKRSNFQSAKKFLIECDYDIDLLLYCFEHLSTQLNLEMDIGTVDNVSLLKELKEIISKNTEAYNLFLIDLLEELNKSKNVIYIKYTSIINTAILFLYFTNIQQYYDSIEEFFNLEQNYDYENIESYLYDHQMFQLLVLCYSSHVEHHEKAVDLSIKLEKGVVVDVHYKGLNNFVNIFNKCKNSKLIINHIEFLLERNQEKGASVLVHNTLFEYGKFTLLEPESVINLLYKYRKALVIYLEYLVFELKIKNSSIHTNLALLYIEIISIQNESEENDSILYKQISDKLHNILETSDYYDSKAVLNGLTKNNLDYETAYLYGKIGDHKKAFEIYLLKHSDYEKALKQCLLYGSIENKKIFNTLLDVYLDVYQKNGPEVMKPLLVFLNHSKCHFDIEHVLQKLPSDWPIDLVSRCLSKSFNTTYNQQYQSSFGKILTLSQLERLKKAKQKLLQKSITVDENSSCIMCNSRLVDSMFVWIPSTDCFLHDFCFHAAS